MGAVTIRDVQVITTQPKGSRLVIVKVHTSEPGLYGHGYMCPNEQPGLGIDIDEKMAARFPCTDEVVQWTQTRWPDGSPARP